MITDAWKQFVSLTSPSLVDFGATSLADQIASALPVTFDHTMADLIRSLDLEPVQRAARDVAEWLERIREEDGEAESLDEVEERLARAKFAVLRKTLVTALTELAAGSKEAGVTVWLALNTFYQTLSPIAKLLLSAYLGALFQEQMQERPPAPAPAAQSVPAAALANPAHRPSEVLVANRNVRVYIEPAPKHSVLAVVPPRHFMRVQQRRPGWYLVSFVPPDGSGVRVVGWVKARGLKPADAETARLVWCALTAVPPVKDCED